MSARTHPRSARARWLAALVVPLVTISALVACGSSKDGAASAPVSNAPKITLTFGFQTADYPELLKASGLFNDLPYNLDTPVISGPAAQISALYSKATDAGLVGENSAAFEAANADQDWKQTGAIILTVAGISNPTSPYPAPSLFVRTDKNINSLADLRGKKIAYNFGGNIYAGYVAFLAKAGLTVKDIEPVQLADNQSAAAAFVAGTVDAVVTGYAQIQKAVDSGQAKRLATNFDVGVAGGAGFISRADVLKDPKKLAALQDFFSRYNKLWTQWYPTHEADVENIYQTVLKQTPAVAKLNYDTTNGSKLYKVSDPVFIQREQAIVDAAYKAGGVKNNRDTSEVYSPLIDPYAVP